MKNFSVRFFYGIFLGVFLIAPLQGASQQWHVTKTKDLGTLSGEAVLRSVTVEKLETPEKSYQKSLCEEARIDALVFSSAAFRLQLLDSPERNKKLAQVMEGSDFLAGVNAGYFHPNGTPLGLVILQGKEIHPQEKAKLLSGFLVITHDTFSLLRVGEKLPAHINDVLQAGPFLMDHRTTVLGLETTRIARRSFLATDNHNHWIMGVISPVTLAEASQILLAASPAFFKTTKIERALNLDGGSSSALWVDLKPIPFSQEEFGYVRNFLGLNVK